MLLAKALQAARACCGHCPVPTPMLSVVGKGMETQVVPSTLRSVQDEGTGGELWLLPDAAVPSQGCFRAVLHGFDGALFRSWQLQLSIPWQAAGRRLQGLGDLPRQQGQLCPADPSWLRRRLGP